MNNYLSASTLVSSRYADLADKIQHHPLYDAIQDKNHLRIFMQHHVYAVWDFMSLIKALQIHIAPTTLPWVPPKNVRFANFINQLVLEEESDIVFTDSLGATHASHFESYCCAMREIGANTANVSHFINIITKQGLETALQMDGIPQTAKRFMAFTFDIISSNQPHLLAAVLAYGRETLVPQIFRSLIEGLKIKPAEAPGLYGYLERHIQLDEQEHGPLTVLIVEEFCEGSVEKKTEVMVVAEQALAVRLDFWNGIHKALLN